MAGSHDVTNRSSCWPARLIIRNDIVFIECTIHNTVIRFYRLTGRFKFEIPAYTIKYFRLNDFWITLYMKWGSYDKVEEPTVINKLMA
jgi:hypothetical protein